MLWLLALLCCKLPCCLLGYCFRNVAERSAECINAKCCNVLTEAGRCTEQLKACLIYPFVTGPNQLIEYLERQKGYYGTFAYIHSAVFSSALSAAAADAERSGVRQVADLLTARLPTADVALMGSLCGAAAGGVLAYELAAGGYLASIVAAPSADACVVVAVAGALTGWLNAVSILSLFETCTDVCIVFYVKEFRGGAGGKRAGEWAKGAGLFDGTFDVNRLHKEYEAARMAEESRVLAEQAKARAAARNKGAVKKGAASRSMV